ncbi:MAG TPA: hypothetical protein VF677_01165 [Flavobacterium sp.]
MYKINDLIRFLRLDRRYDEAEAQNKGADQNQVNAVSLLTNDSRVIDRKEFENFNIYIRIVDILDRFRPSHFYILTLPYKSTFYIKTAEEGGEFLNLETSRSETVSDEAALQKIDIGFATYNYFYDKGRREVIILEENLREITLFGDSILFDPEKIGISSGTYTYHYSKPISTFGQFINGVLKIIQFFANPLANSGNKKEDVEVSVKKKGTIYLIPTIYNVGDDYYLYYYYTSIRKKLFYQVGEEDIALKLKFNGKEPFLCFLNETIFTQQNFDYPDSQYNERRAALVNDFKSIIMAPLEKDLRSTFGFRYYDAMVTLYYLTDNIVLTLSSDGLWSLFEYAVSRNSLTNKSSLEEETIFVKLLEAIAGNEKTKNYFLSRLLRKKDPQTTYLQFLFDRIHGENGLAFCNLVNKSWKTSRFINPDPEENKEFASTDGPFILPYESEKWLGFYFSNVSISFDTNARSEPLLKTLYETGIYKKEMRPGLKTDNLVSTPVEIIDQFWYHPFYPIYLKDIESQETDMKLDAVVPAFMLKANQNKQFWSNVMTSAEYALDVVTTLSGIGNIAKFRYLTKLAQLAETVEGVNAATKAAQAVNILRYVKGAAGVVEVTSGAVNAMLKITGARDTEFGESLSRVLFYLELITLAGELTASMKLGLKKSAREAVETSDGALRMKHPELFAELYKIAGLKKVYQHVDDFMQLRPRFQDLALVNKLWKERIVNKMLFPANLRKLYSKYLKEFPGLEKGFNQAEFKTTILNKGQKVQEVVEFSLSGDKSKLTKYFGNPTNLPENTIDILSDYDNFEAFVKGASDFGNVPRNYDSEIKYIFNFLKNHIDKGDEFIVETQNIFKTCGSCRREFVMLEDYLKLQGKKVKIVVISDETIEGTRDLLNNLKIKPKK